MLSAALSGVLADVRGRLRQRPNQREDRLPLVPPGGCGAGPGQVHQVSAVGSSRHRDQP
jgi:hypothetical protein